MTPIPSPPRGDHLHLEKDHFKGDHLTRLKHLKPNNSAVLGGHFTSNNDNDRGGHLSPPLFIEGVTSGTHTLTIFIGYK